MQLPRVLNSVLVLLVAGIYGLWLLQGPCVAAPSVTLTSSVVIDETPRPSATASILESNAVKRGAFQAMTMCRAGGFTPQTFTAGAVSSPSAHTAWPQCEAVNGSVAGLPLPPWMSTFNASYADLVLTTASECAPPIEPKRVVPCHGMIPVVPRAVHSTNHWDSRATLAKHPLFQPMHGGVTAIRYLKLARKLAAFADLPHESAPAASWPNGTTVVELGCGSASMLSAVCPPHAHIRCVGTDISPQGIEVAKKFLPHAIVVRQVDAAVVPTGVASAAMSMGVIIALPRLAVCNHIAELLRVLKPGGKAVLFGIPRIGPRVGSWSMFADEFFVSPLLTSDNAPTLLPYCSGLHDMVANVTFPCSRHASVYHEPTFMGVVLTRSEARFSCRRDDVTASREAFEELFKQRWATAKVHSSNSTDDGDGPTSIFDMNYFTKLIQRVESS